MTITTQDLLLHLPQGDTMIAHLIQMRQSIMLFVGAPPTLLALRDFACAMPPIRPGSAPSAALSSTAPASTAMSTKLSRRYKRQVFLSLDLSSLRPARGPSISNEQDNAVLALERAIIEQLDKVLRESS